MSCCVGTILTPVDRRDPVAVIASLVEQYSDMVVVVDASGRLRWANRASERVLGPDRAAKLGLPLLDLVHPDDRPQVVEALASTLDGSGGFEPIHVRVHCADGTWRDVEASATNMLDEPTIRGDRAHRAGHHRASGSLERRVHELEHSFASVFRHSPVGRAIVDLDGCWLQVNDACAELLGR